MSAAIAVKKSPDGTIFARRLDGQPLTEADRDEARRIAEAEPADGPSFVELTTEQAAEIDSGKVPAVLIDSTVLGGPIWFALVDGWRPDEADGIPIFYASELPALRMKTPEQLRSIFNIKRTFGGGKVIK